MKKFLICLLLPVFLAVSCPSTPTASQQKKGVDLSYVPKTPDTENNYSLEPMSEKTAFDYFRDEKLLAGINIGNSLDAYNNGKASETSWGNPKINQELLNGVKKAGFDLVRIPVTWMGYIGPAPDHHINETYLARVAEVAEMAHKAGLKAIINLHHDGSTVDGGKDNGWLSINKARASTEGYNEITHKYVRVWKQIAAYFKNHGDWLIFEGLNEIHDGRWGNGSVQGPQTDILNDWNRFFTQTVRSTGANNEKRYLVIAGYSTNPRHTLANYFWLPPDIPGRQIVTFHYYDPYEFGIAATRSEWGSEADKNRVASDFAPFKSVYIESGIPVIIGECGAVKQSGDKARQARLDYLAWVFGKARENNLVPIYWDNGATSGNGEKFGLFNRSNGQPNSDESEACIKAMIGAVGK
ncbi:MAG: glycoside hydrolase family 5 protein [Treponema sp.]|jgi:endoglucanase|nr:glycoside hydrolase family 5 protein [Treponema sp.]